MLHLVVHTPQRQRSWRSSPVLQGSARGNTELRGFKTKGQQCALFLDRPNEILCRPPARPPTHPPTCHWQYRSATVETAARAASQRQSTPTHHHLQRQQAPRPGPSLESSGGLHCLGQAGSQPGKHCDRAAGGRGVRLRTKAALSLTPYYLKLHS